MNKKSLGSCFLVIFLLVLALSPLGAFAQSSPSPASPGGNDSSGSSLSLKPPDTDFSVGYLSNIFGNVDGVLTSSGSQLLGTMFSVFNGAVLVLGGIVILYTLFVSTLNTAAEGEMLGKRWSSIWIPLRSVMGIALLVPKASGYSFVQIFMMWVAVMGVGAADSTWNKALNYFVSGGLIIQPSINLNASSSSSVAGSNYVTNAAMSAFQSLVCVAMLEKELNQYRDTFQDSNPAKPPAVPNFYQAIINAITSQGGNQNAFVNFPTIVSPVKTYYSGLEGVCGTLYWNNPTNVVPYSTTTFGPRTSAVASMVSSFEGAAQSVVSNYQQYVQKSSGATGNPLPLGTIIGNVAGVNIWGEGSLTAPKSYLLGGTLFSSAVQNYYGNMSAALNTANQGQEIKNITSWVTTAEQAGWILAGSYYLDLINLNSQAANLGEVVPPTFALPKDPSIGAVPGFFGANGASSQYVAQMKDLFIGSGSSASASYVVGPTSIFTTQAQVYGNSLNSGNVTLPSMGGGSGDLGSANINKIMGPVQGIGGFIKDGLMGVVQSQQNNVDPVVSIAHMGNGLVGTVFWTYIGVAIAVYVIGMILGALWGFAFAAGFAGLIQVIMGIISPILIPLMVVGLTMSFYIPMIPFIIFTFGVIGWFISVVEAIIAAPLVALGIAHPEGAEILGKAEPAVGLLVNVFLRPTFMIFGLLIGIMLSYVGVWIVNLGFFHAFGVLASKTSDATAGGGGPVTGLFEPIALLVIYVLIVLQVVQKSFTLIYVIPDEVLKWIGINIKGMGGEAEAEGKTAGGFQGAAQAQGESTSKAGEASKGAMDTGAAHQKASDEAKESPHGLTASTKKGDGGGGGGASGGGSSKIGKGK